MITPRRAPEKHLIQRVGWLRAAVLGANDGLLSTASLILGVAAAAAKPADILVAGAAGLVAGSMSMAAGEYVSVSSQADTERADLARETAEQKADIDGEHRELAAIYVGRGLRPDTAEEVARQLMARDPLEAHARDELGISHHGRARPVQAALTSAATFAGGGAMPLIVAGVTPAATLLPVLCGATTLFLAILGAAGAQAGGAKPWKGALRVTFWGVLAMAVTAGIGRLVGTAV